MRARLIVMCTPVYGKQTVTKNSCYNVISCILLNHRYVCIWMLLRSRTAVTQNAGALCWSKDVFTVNGKSLHRGASTQTHAHTNEITLVEWKRRKQWLSSPIHTGVTRESRFPDIDKVNSRVRTWDSNLMLSKTAIFSQRTRPPAPVQIDRRFW